MNVEVHFAAEYTYAEVVSFSIHRFRLFPRAARHARVRKVEFGSNADAQISYQRDLFDNEIASCFYPEKGTTLTAWLLLDLELEPRDPFAFVLASHAMEFPFRYTDTERAILAPYLSEEAAPELAFWQADAKPQPTVEMLVGLNKALHDNLRYERRDEGAAWSPAETVQTGGGSCRDFSVLLAATLRRLGFAARLVSGYIVETGEREKRAEGALHAWTETYVPGAGWLGLDPTNGILCDHHHIAAAVGLTPDDIAPSLGSYFHPRHVTSTMTSSLEVRL